MFSSSGDKSIIKFFNHLLNKRNSLDPTDFDEIKDLISAKTLVTVDDHITKLEDVKKKVSDRRDTLRQKATDEKLIDDTSSVDIADRY